MALTPAQLITQLYIGYYDRAPDPAGLNYWVGIYNSGQSILQIAEYFSVQDESLAAYPYLQNPNIVSPSDFITEVYQNLFDRDPDPAGLAYWINQLETGAVTVGGFIATVQFSANSDPTTNDYKVLNNKTAVGLDYAVDVATAGVPWSMTSAKDVVSGVGLSDASVAAGLAKTDAFIAGGGGAPMVFDLTTGVDDGPNFVGKAGDDTFNAAVVQTALLPQQTLNDSDFIDGGAGRNKLNVQLVNAFVSPLGIKNIQEINIAGGPPVLGIPLLPAVAIDLINANDVDTINFRSPITNTDVFGVTTALTNIGIADDIGGNAFFIENVGGVGGANDIVFVALKNANGSSLEIDSGYETVGIESTGAVTNVFELVTEGPTTIGVAGDQDLVLFGGALNLSTLESFDATALDADLDADFFGGTGTEAVTIVGAQGDNSLFFNADVDTLDIVTYGGDDLVEINKELADGGLSADLGEGSNVLSIYGVATPDDVSGLDFTGGISNVQTLEFQDGLGWFPGFNNETATLDLDGFSSDLETVTFASFVDIAADLGNELVIANSPEVLTVDFAGGSQFLSINVTDATDLTLTGTSAQFQSGILEGANLETVKVDVSGVLLLNMDDNANALVDLDAEAGGNASVNLNSDGTQLSSLTNVKVGSGNNAVLNMNGAAGVVAVAGVQQIDEITINVTGAGGAGFNPSTSAGDVVFSSGDLNAGVVATNYSTTLGFPLNQNGNFLHDVGAANDIAAQLNALAEVNATNPVLTNDILVTWQDFGPQQAFAQAPGTAATTGALNSLTINTLVAGVTPVAMVPGAGFEDLETVTVDGVADATANLTNVYGLFTLAVTAGDDATLNLFNTNATSVSVAAGTGAGDIATVNVGGDTIGNWSLVDLTVSGANANVTLDFDLSSFEVLDVAGVTTNLIADTSGADFLVGVGQFIVYEIGATSDGNNLTVDVDFTGNAVRELYAFVGTDIGNVLISDFTTGNDPLIGDRIDLSGFGFTNAGQLVFTDVGGDLVITDLAGGPADFSGSITIAGAAGLAADVATFNIIYA